MPDKIRVATVDDSKTIQFFLKRVIDSISDFECVGQWSTGEEALDCFEEVAPDVITVDLMMKGMDGIETIEKMMGRSTVGILMVSSFTDRGAKEAIAALQAGAFDYLKKPDLNETTDAKQFVSDFSKKVRAASHYAVQISNNKEKTKENKRTEQKAWSRRETLENIPDPEVVVIGVSTGGPKILPEVLSFLPAKVGFSLVIVQHMPEAFTAGFAERLNRSAKFPVHLAQNGRSIEKGKGYLAPGGFNLMFSRTSEEDPYIILSRNDFGQAYQPSVDITMISAAKGYQDNVLGIVLTGMGKDGTKGLQAIKKNGGFTLSEHPSSSIVYGMPKSAWESEAANAQMTSVEIGRLLSDLSQRMLAEDLSA